MPDHQTPATAAARGAAVTGQTRGPSTEASASSNGGPRPIRIVAYGQPKPKGSLRHVGKGRMVEQLEGSKPWRVAIKEATLDVIRAADFGIPLYGPIRIEASITVPRPKSAPKRRRTWPITRSSGDIDKHARNVLDALVDASLIGDDSQVIELTIEKDYAGARTDHLAVPGIVVDVWQVET